MLVLWPSAQGGFGSIVADTTGGEGRKAGGQSPWRGHSPPHSLLSFLWSVPDPLRGLWSQNRVSKTTKNLKMAAQLNQELSPAELGVCGVAQEAGLHSCSLGLACCWLGREEKARGAWRFQQGAPDTCCWLPLCRHPPPLFFPCERGLWAVHAFQPLQLRKSFPLDWGPKLG